MGRHITGSDLIIPLNTSKNLVFPGVVVTQLVFLHPIIHHDPPANRHMRTTQVNHLNLLPSAACKGQEEDDVSQERVKLCCVQLAVLLRHHG